ncbi:MAG: pentapeptide repeat-containing protein [Gammaproteobacteria bacterium]|nr:pentapeptide repeat-containing protein [Gammaproteobacteria bacterium]
MDPVTSIIQLEKLLQAQSQFTEVTFEEFEWPEESEEFRFSHCHFLGIGFRDNQFLECHFEDCEFDSCAFDSARLSDCTFHKCKFYNSEKEAGCSFKFASFPGTTFCQSDLSLCNFSRANLYRMEMEQCQGTGMDCSYATTAQNIGPSVTLNSARLADCNFSYADFTGAWLCDAELPENRFSHALFNNANLENTVLVDCDLHGIEAKDVVIRGADLRGAQISGLDIREIDMTGVKINDYQQRVLLEEIGLVVE